MEEKKEDSQYDQEEVMNQILEHAAELMVKDKKGSDEVKNILVEEGLDKEIATTVVKSLEVQIKEAKKSRAQKDMLYGALWCVGGIIATVAGIGFIFWGAILFGGIQFFRGVIRLG